MVLPYVKIPPPPMSNQTPVGPNNPWPIAYQYQVKQQIKEWLPHSTPSVDNYQGVPQRIKTRIPTNLPPGVNPGSYGFIVESPQPGGIKTIDNIVGRINSPAGYTITPGIVSLGYQGIEQHIKVPINQIVPGDVYPDTYGKRKMSYDGTSTFLIGAVVGFIGGAIIFTATGKKAASEITSAASRRVSNYIQPKS